MIGSYPKIFGVGHRALHQALLDPVVVQEKVDGSQFSFGVYGGELKCRSKGAEINIDAPDSMFTKAVETAKELAPILVPGWTYRAEYLQKPKHNTLAYDRVPHKNLILFDVDAGDQDYFDPDKLKQIADCLGLECVPCFIDNERVSLETCRSLLDRVSVLGGQKIEGVVIKNYNRFGDDKKILIGKIVSDQFKELHQVGWKADNPNRLDVVAALIDSLRTPARWQKAIQHLKEAGKLEGSPRDIGPLVKEIQQDIQDECREYISEKLYEWAIGNIRRGVVGGFPEWYKEQLCNEQASEQEAAA